MYCIFVIENTPCELSITGVFVYIEVSLVEARNGGRLVSPYLPDDGKQKCMEGSYNLYGKTVGRLIIEDERYAIKWESISLNKRNYMFFKRSLK